jgi:hypothetical protein
MIPFWLSAGFYFVAFEFLFWFFYHHLLAKMIPEWIFYVFALPISIFLFGLFVKYTAKQIALNITGGSI